MPTYKIIPMCIECATVLRGNNACVTCEYKIGEGVRALLFMIDKLMLTTT